MTSAECEGLLSIMAGRFPLSCQNIVHTQPRQGWHVQWSEVRSLSHSFCLLEGHLCLVPLLQGMIDIAQGNEKALQMYRQREGSRKPGDLLYKSERLFVSSHIQQPIREADRSVDLCPA